VEVRSDWVEFAGYRISYRVAGAGPALVIVNPHRYPKERIELGRLSGRFRVIQVSPLGFGDSDRPENYPAAGIHEQVLRVADSEAADRFVIWGYSQGGAMAAAVAQATARVTAMVTGGFSLLDQPTDAWIRRMDREQRVPVAARTFWHWYKRFDWLHELGAMQIPKLVYVGAMDRTQAPGIRRTRDLLRGRGMSVIQFDGLDHLTCQRGPDFSGRVLPTLLKWLDEHLT
jgi:pimeloyl-ACP methyl ester carboxylesterase